MPLYHVGYHAYVVSLHMQLKEMQSLEASALLAGLHMLLCTLGSAVSIDIAMHVHHKHY